MLAWLNKVYHHHHHRLPHGIVSRCYEQTLWVFGDRLPSKHRLAPYKTHLCALASRKVSRKRKKTYLTQRRKPVNSSFTARSGCARKFVLDMKHSKKMVLVPEKALQRYEQRQRLETSPLMGTMMHKDAQISHILQRDDVPDDQKQKLFNAYFERFLEMRRQKETQSPMPTWWNLYPEPCVREPHRSYPV